MKNIFSRLWSWIVPIFSMPKATDDTLEDATTPSVTNPDWKDRKGFDTHFLGMPLPLP
jgi:hypothetical protein